MFSFFYDILITPLELLIEVVYTLSSRLLHDPGIAIIVVSLIVNFMLLPLYLRAEALSAAESARMSALSRWRTHIRKAFRADERSFRMNCYYREANYNPGSALITIIPLLLQIPFFIAAYHFFSGLSVLSGTPFFAIADLAQPDHLISLPGGVCLNLLPLLMTGINLLSILVYAKGSPVQEMLRSFALAVFFLILLYQSPSGLVIYWTMNNLFSLVKNILLRKFPSVGKNKEEAPLQSTPDRVIPLLLLLELTLFLGGIVPADVIGASVTEMVNIGPDTRPLHFAFYSLRVYFGIFFVWGNILRLILPPKARSVYTCILLAFVFAILGDYYFFTYTGGSLSNSLTLISAPEYDSEFYVLRNIVVVFFCSLLGMLLWKKYPRFILAVSVSLPLLSSFYYIRDLLRIRRESDAWYQQRAFEETVYDKTVIPLSKNGQNVIIIGLDRAISSYIPFIFTERPELFSSFDGFVWYPNTASFGKVTPLGMPPLMGGYDYTPSAMNARSDELLLDKNNEALRVMPTLFGENGYEVTVIDPPLANYKIPGDLSIYDDLPFVNTFRMDGYCAEVREKEAASSLLERNIIFYPLYRTTPALFQNFFYDEGYYFNASGYFPPSCFTEANAALRSLSSVTEINNSGDDTLLILYNNTTHEPTLLSAPEYDYGVSRRGYTDPLPESITLGDQKLEFTNIVSRSYAVAHYHINMAAMLRLADYFDYLKQEGVWDNTRIIIVADHGWDLSNYNSYKFTIDLPPEYLSLLNDELREQIDVLYVDLEAFNPLLLVKDFNAKGFSIDNQFMTNADVPFLAADGLINDPVNPYTHRPLSTLPKQHGIEIVNSSVHDTSIRMTQFRLQDTFVFSVHDNIFDPSDWSISIWEDQEQ